MKPSPLTDNTSAGFVHPEMVNGKRLWVDPEVKRIVDLMQNGSPAHGWEGDPFLALFRGDRNTWVINRYENGTYHTVMVSRPGLVLDERLIIRLVEQDLRRRSAESLKAEIDKANDAVAESKVERISDAMQKVYWGVGKDTGEGRKFVSLAGTSPKVD